ncbi:MAG TPA: Nif3-like dinuclear metal center hexameric protein [Sedimentisphaerales bacterium]|nr:Nif3-like dinuclear metal center hexameric protein [Sedimentisphaerales bacterium]
MKVRDIANTIRNIVPLELALDWDNVGLLVGNGQKEVKNILLTIDISKDVIAEAKKLRTDMILSYHPVIWDGLKTVTAEGSGGIVYALIKSDIAVFSVHTAVDIMFGGVNDGLAEMVGITDAKPIGDFVSSPSQDNYKLVVFVPQKSLAAVTNAVFKAGAGAIGNYSNCGFASQGVGTFKPLKGSKPAIGERGKIEKVDEIRFEAIVPAEKVEGCIEAMRKAHPYEMPAYDCLKLYERVDKFGLGRIGKLGKPTQLTEIIKRIKKATGAKAFGFVGNEKRLVKTAAVCAGSCGKIINSVIAQNVDLYLTGEIKHHQALAAKEAGVSCICLSHTVSERFVLKKLAKELQNQLKGLNINISKKDTDPFNWKNI